MELRHPKLNHVVLSGRATKDTELKTTQNGKEICQFSMAVDRPSYKDSEGNWKNSAFFINVVCWGFQAKYAAEKVSKGSPMIVQGRLDIREAEINGETRKFTEITVSDIQVIAAQSQGSPSSSRDDEPPAPDEPF